MPAASRPTPSPPLLKAYENHLRARRVTPNTLSTYLRMLRAIYNYGVATARARYIPALFRDVFTGVDTRQKKALPRAQLRLLLHADPGRADLRQAQSLARPSSASSSMPIPDAPTSARPSRLPASSSSSAACPLPTLPTWRKATSARAS